MRSCIFLWILWDSDLKFSYFILIWVTFRVAAIKLNMFWTITNCYDRLLWKDSGLFLQVCQLPQRHLLDDICTHQNRHLHHGSKSVYFFLGHQFCLEWQWLALLRLWPVVISRKLQLQFCIYSQYHGVCSSRKLGIIWLWSINISKDPWS
jgi:hypothetical protein